MDKNKVIMIAGGTLVLGLVFGYALGGEKRDMHGGKHRMSNGEMMDNDKGMEQMMHSMNARLEGKSGAEFDRIFLEDMIVHHEGAVDMAELAMKNAEHQEIKDLASAIIAAQNDEIAKMKSWKSEWFSN